MMVDTFFEGQRKAAVKTREAGLTIVRMSVRNVPTIIETDDSYSEKLYMEDCRFDGISSPAIVISNENNTHTQINLRNVVCREVPVLASFRESGRVINGAGSIYSVKFFTHGNQMDELKAPAVLKTTHSFEIPDSFPAPLKTDIPDLPSTHVWFNLSNAGVKGDGVTAALYFRQ